MHAVVLLQTATPPPASPPWWFAGTIGVVGIILGIAIKSIIDAVTTRANNRREDELRFIHDKSVAYSELLSACGQLADTEHEIRQLNARIANADDQAARLLAAGRPAPVDDYFDELDTLDSRRTDAYRELNRVAAIVDLIGSEPVAAAANTFVSRAHHPHLLKRRLDAEAAYIDAARADLGYPPTSHIHSQPYEDYIPYDNPESGVDVPSASPC